MIHDVCSWFRIRKDAGSCLAFLMTKRRTELSSKKELIVILDPQCILADRRPDGSDATLIDRDHEQ